MYFHKLKIKCPPQQFTVKELVGSYGNRISYYNFESDFDLFSFLPEKYRKLFFSRYLEVTGNLPPHTDSGILCTINFYIQPSNCITSFWTVTNSSAKPYQLVNQTNGKIFPYEALQYENSFYAEENDIWLLDVSKPHSVLCPNSTVRKALCLSSPVVTYEECRQIFLDTQQL